MSAWILPDRHLNTLVAWAARHSVAYYRDDVRHEINGDEARVAAVLYAANVRSVNHRYDETTPTGGYLYRQPTQPLPSPLEILKMCDCYDYQACEVDDYDYRSEAWQIVDTIRGHAICTLPGYREAQHCWPLGWDDPESDPDPPADWQPSYNPWRHGGWYVSNVQYPNGAIGCVSRNYPDHKWRIVCDPRRGDQLNTEGDFTYPTRDAAARAEYVLAQAATTGEHHAENPEPGTLHPGG